MRAWGISSPRWHASNIGKKITLAVLALLFALGPMAASAASPRINYLLHCSGCHLPGGEGAPPNVPTMHDVLGRMMAVPQMRSYLVRVPGSAQSALSDTDLTAVVNWVLTEFNAKTLPADFEPLTRDEVATARKSILADPLKYRIQHWRNYGED